MAAIDPERWYTAREAAELLDGMVTDLTLKSYCREKKVRAKKQGPRRQWVIFGGDILRLRREWQLDG